MHRCIAALVLVPLYQFCSAAEQRTCCPNPAQYPDTYIWNTLNASSTSGRSPVTYVRYDPFGLIERVWIAEVDGNRPKSVVADKPARDVKCPRNLVTPSRYHADNTANPNHQILCYDQYLKPRKWYVVCERKGGSGTGCTSCYTDYTGEPNDKKWVDLDTASSTVSGNALKLRFRISHSVVPYNVTAEILEPHQETLKQFSIGGSSNQVAEATLDNVAAKIRNKNVYLYIKPRGPNEFGCPALGPGQIIIRKSDGTAAQQRRQSTGHY